MPASAAQAALSLRIMFVQSNRGSSRNGQVPSILDTSCPVVVFKGVEAAFLTCKLGWPEFSQLLKKSRLPTILNICNEVLA